jgi:hypothetical protein
MARHTCIYVATVVLLLLTTVLAACGSAAVPSRPPSAPPAAVIGTPTPVMADTAATVPATGTPLAATACPVTRPVPAMQPPATVVGSTRASNWYGNDALWVVLPPNGPWRGGKFGWWRALPGQLTVQGRRLDGPAPPLEAHVPKGYGDIGFQASGLTFPREGCWEVIGTVAEKQLTFVVDVEFEPAGDPAVAEEIGVWETLAARPLRLPALPPGAACPRTAARQVSPHIGHVLGDGLDFTQVIVFAAAP